MTEDDGHERQNNVPSLRPHRHPEPPENEMRSESLESNVGDLRPKREIDAGQTDGQVTGPLDRESVSVMPSVRGASTHRVEHIERLTIDLPVKTNACMSMEKQGHPTTIWYDLVTFSAIVLVDKVINHRSNNDGMYTYIPISAKRRQ